MKKKLLSVLLVLVMLIAVFPPSVLAADDAVAKIGNVTYTDLQEAFDAAQEGDTVELTADLTLDKQITASYSGAFDLKGHTLSLAHTTNAFRVINADLILVNGTVFVEDNSAGDEYIRVNGDAALTVENCNITFTKAEEWNWLIVNFGDLTLGKGTEISVSAVGPAAAALIPVAGSTCVIDGANITAVSSKGDGYGIYMGYGGTVDFKSGTITGDGKTNGANVAEDSVFNMYEGAEIKNVYNAVLLGEDATFNMFDGSFTDCNYGVFIGENAIFNMSGGVIDASIYGLSGNGTNKTQYTTINVSGDAKIYSSYTPIYQPQNGEINISGNAYLEGESCIGIKSGTLNISGGTFRAVGEYDENAGVTDGNGYKPDGSTIVVDDQGGNYYGNVEINISGGELTSDYGHNISVTRAVLDDPENDPTHKPAVVYITGGTLDSAQDTFRKSGENNAMGADVTISGGFVLKNGKPDMGVNYGESHDKDAGWLAGPWLNVDRETGEVHNTKAIIKETVGGTVVATPAALDEDNLTFTITATPLNTDFATNYSFGGLTITDADGKTVIIDEKGKINNNSDGCLIVEAVDNAAYAYTVKAHCDITVKPTFIGKDNAVIEDPVISVDTSATDLFEDKHLEDTKVSLPKEDLQRILDEIKSNTGVEEARQALVDAGIIDADSDEEAYLQIATEIKVVVLDYDVTPNTPNYLKLEITPYYYVFATTSPNTPVTIGEKQGEDFVLLNSSEYRISGTDLNIPMTVPLPDGFAEAGTLISIEHDHVDNTGKMHKYAASARVKEDGTVSFRNRHGFSVFTFRVDSTAGLDDLQVLDTERDLLYPLAPEFDTDVLEYVVHVLNYVNYVQIKPTVDVEGLIITVNGVEVTSDNWSDYIMLNVGKNVITVKVSDGDDESSLIDNVYTIIIYRADVDQPEIPGIVDPLPVDPDPVDPDPIDPVDPVVPDEPTEPDTPDVPDAPKAPDAPNNADTSPNTGNNAVESWRVITFLLAASLLCAELFISKKRKHLSLSGK